jgi:hypothetical protein
MADLKTIPTKVSVDKFLRGITDEKKRADCYQILELMKKITKAEPKMWGTSIVGFGRFHYVYESGHAGDWFLAGFSPRKQNLTIYLMGGFEGCTDLLNQLGKYSTGKGCLYINKLADVDLKILRKLIGRSIQLTVKNGR